MNSKEIKIDCKENKDVTVNLPLTCTGLTLNNYGNGTISLSKSEALEVELLKLRKLLERKYFEEFIVIDGINQHPDGLNFEKWLLRETPAEVCEHEWTLGRTRLGDKIYWCPKCNENTDQLG